MSDENRLARIEFKAEDLTESFKEYREVTQKKLDDLHQKLDDLLALRNKGAGMLWILSSILGAGLINGFYHLWKLMGFH